VSDAPAPFTCPCCGQVNRHPDDIANRYCGVCHWQTGDPVLGPPHTEMPCEARPPRAGNRERERRIATRFAWSGVLLGEVAAWFDGWWGVLVGLSAVCWLYAGIHLGRMRG
jgi:hypothetical protein